MECRFFTERPIGGPAIPTLGHGRDQFFWDETPTICGYVYVGDPLEYYGLVEVVGYRQSYQPTEEQSRRWGRALYFSMAAIALRNLLRAEKQGIVPAWVKKRYPKKKYPNMRYRRLEGMPDVGTPERNEMIEALIKHIRERTRFLAVTRLDYDPWFCDIEFRDGSFLQVGFDTGSLDFGRPFIRIEEDI